MAIRSATCCWVYPSYGYAYSGNQLQSINGGASYRYDDNGNATTDGRSGFTIAYNALNLPQSVSKGGESVTYTYDATGAKLAVTNPDGTARYYHGSMVYGKDKSLDLVLHEEGTIKVSTTYAYQYHLKDHLGNTRAMFSKNAGANQPVALAQVTDYYPFGKSFENSNVDKNRYLYNGKEFQDQVIGGTQFGWYDYGARFYDPELGRWHTMDPLAEKYPNMSSYNYCTNNPVRFIDPNGMNIDTFIFDPNGKLKSYELNDQSDKVYVINAKREFDDPDKSELKEVKYSNERVEKLMNDNGFKKVKDKETVVVKETTNYITEADGSNNEVGKYSVDVKILDSKTKYVENNKTLQSMNTDHVANLNRKHNGTSLIETNVVKRTYDYDKKDYSNTVNTFVNFVLRVINSFQ